MIMRDFPERHRFLALDRDGTLVGTCNANFEAYGQALKEFGIKDYKGIKNHLHEGKSWASICADVYPDFTPSLISKIRTLKTEIFPNYFDLLNWNDELIDQTMLTKWAMVSNGSVVSSMLILKTKPRLSPVLVIGPNEQLRPKPFPDMYNHLVRTLGIPSTDMLVYEDSNTGKKAAEIAGLEIKMITHRC
jgi:beta-phosphoglucomutase-like phosphatase (HAD superfamily)